MRKLLISLVLLFSCSAAMALPSVTGNTISWPDDGWYQVQKADTFESVCGGGSSCDVEPGRYIVINHTTGERYQAIVVQGSNDSSFIPAALFALSDFGSNSLLILDNGSFRRRVLTPEYNCTSLTSLLPISQFCNSGKLNAPLLGRQFIQTIDPQDQS